MKLAIILCAVLVVQYLLSFIQIQHYKKNINKIVSDYRGEDGFFMFSGMERGKFRPGAIAVLVVDKEYIVHECHLLNGMSVLTKFKAIEKYKGQHVGEILSDINEDHAAKGRNKVPAFQKALLKAGENALLAISKNKVSMGV
ncbi:transcriptional regulator [Bacillus sp. FJAT-27225]|uniref:transcriptional regulator GutM n=1 Tax=Bacillus sp. FJAT-27225 TaxID=1743144 RepID=UPI00080C30AE|nr:transcriptional regulator GutM [Bacillus sp. FJAT-27225]OCA87790.1 transcriptional regulator [Bacillus sp. FJAT-27225]